MLTIDMNVLRPHKIGVGRDLLKDCGKYIKRHEKAHQFLNQKLPESVLAARKCNAGQKEKQRNMKRIYILSIDSPVVKHMPDNYKKYTDSLSGIESKYPLF